VLDRIDLLRGGPLWILKVWGYRVACSAHYDKCKYGDSNQDWDEKK
jgi:hypothetical protein